MSKNPNSERKTLTTAAGIPVGDNQNSLTAGPRGPLLVQDWQLFEKHAHFNRERIPERVVHAKGSAAFGSFTVTGDITQTDLAEGRSSGLTVVQRILRDVDDVGFSKLGAKDVVRHRLVAAIVDAYEVHESRRDGR